MARWMALIGPAVFIYIFIVFEPPSSLEAWFNMFISLFLAAFISGACRAIGLTPWLDPKAGLFLWCHLPSDLDAADVARAALKEGIVLAPGNAFSISHTAGNFMRFNAAQMSDTTIIPAIEKSMHRVRKI